MKFGLSFLPDCSPNTKSAAGYFRDALELSSIADQAGFETIKMTEHYLHPYGGYCPSPLMFLTAVAARTQNIRLMTGCILPAFHHPIQIASHTALLDVISGGRLDVGFGRAYLPYEFEAFGVPLDESRDRYSKAILAVIDLWENEKSSSTTDYFSFKNAMSLPKPIQSPHPPVWGAAVSSRQSFAWLGEQGFNLLISPPFQELESLLPMIEIYRTSFAENNPEKTSQIGLSMPLILDESHDRAVELAKTYLSRYLQVWADATKDWDITSSSDYPKYQGISQILRAASPASMLKNRQALAGTPEEIDSQINWIQEYLGVDQILWQIDFGSQPFEVSKKTIELLQKVFK